MSYNNYSYYDAPKQSTEWWGGKGTGKVSFDEDRQGRGPNKQRPQTRWNLDMAPQQPQFSQSTAPNYGQPLPPLPLETSRAPEPVQPRHEVIQGTVTQLFSNFGYIDDNIIFSKSDIIGPMVQIGDRVAVDATFQPNNPTKYKGERVCKLDDCRPNSSTNAAKSFNNQSISPRGDLAKKDVDDKTTSIVRKEASPKNKADKKADTPQHSDSNSTYKRPEEIKEIVFNNNKDKPIETKEKSQDGETKTPKKKTAKKVDTSRRTDISKSKAISPFKIQRSPQSVSLKRKSESKSKCISKNYESFAFRELDCAAVKNQCRTLTLPPEFFHVSLKYQQSFPLNHPMKLGNNCHFKVMDKRVKSIDSFIDAQLSKSIDPEDADTTFVAKVMLLSTDDLAKFYKDTLTLAEEFDGDNKVPITKAIKFLVGSVGENKEFGIGGAWSPSLDGVDPERNPRVLINTAIRTCKATTGIDLSNCSSWPKFLELRYYRPLQKLHKKKYDSNGTVVNEQEVADEPCEYREPRMETVVYYIPDVWNCVPTLDSWTEIKKLYQEQLTCLMCPPPLLSSNMATAGTTTSATHGTEPTKVTDGSVTTDDDNQEEEDWNFNETDEVEDKTTTTTAITKNSAESVLEDQPTHFSKLVVGGMKIIEIKKELELRKLNNRGVMDQLKARLKAVLEREEMEEKLKEVPNVPKQSPVLKKVSERVLSDNEKSQLKKLYSLPDEPHIVVHQNRKIFGKQMKVRTMSLHSLLSYYNIKLQESTFELAVFAKQFLEMMRRDAVFNIYKSIVVAPDKDLVNLDESAKKSKLMVTTSKRTIDRPLLFSCSLLDREKRNKISLEDLKILIEGLGICLSTNQLSEVLGKVKDSGKYLNYRQLTDKEIMDSDIGNIMNMEATEDLDYIKELALGNKALFDEELGVLDSTVNDEEIERLKNELDKSERCRQSIELKVAVIKDETERSISLSKSQAKEIVKLKEHGAEYRTKYQAEKQRGDSYKRDFQKLLRQLTDIDKLTNDLNKNVSSTLGQYTTPRKTTVSGSSESVDSKKDKIKKVSVDKSKKTTTTSGEDKSKKEHNVSSQQQQDVSVAEVTNQKDVEMIEGQVVTAAAAVEPVSNIDDEKKNESVLGENVSTMETEQSSIEYFELPKPSEYDDDMIVLDETDNI